jgi:hypothetical protein
VLIVLSVVLYICIIYVLFNINLLWYMSILAGANVRTHKTNIFTDVLEKVSAAVIARKQRAIERLAPGLQYSTPPPAALADPLDEAVWSSPVRDAVEIFIDGMANRAQLRRRGQLSAEEVFNTPAYQMDKYKWLAKYSEVIIE